MYELDIRRYAPPDKTDVWRLHNLALDAVGANAGDGPWDDDLHHIEDVYLRRGEFLIGLCEGRIVAMGALKRSSTASAEIKRMRVHPNFQRRGFGQQILSRLEQAATKTGVVELHLDTTEQQVAAQHLYEKNDYVLLRTEVINRFHVFFYRKSLIRAAFPASNCRSYGSRPFVGALVHGGPGAAGEMAPVARQLALEWGVLEALQTRTTLSEQVTELRSTLESFGQLPCTLIGYSWGAWLGVLVAARHPSIVNKLILISSGPFEESYVERMQRTRLDRLSQQEQLEWAHTMRQLGSPVVTDKSPYVASMTRLTNKTDQFLPTSSIETGIEPFRPELYESVWPEADSLRRSGRLLEEAAQLSCPVAAIHGDFDPHPADGVRTPLGRLLKNFKFILLKDCGHTPWRERRAAGQFYASLTDCLRSESYESAQNH